MLSNYGLYVKEREGLDILENEQGFFTYRITGEECYIKDIFITKEARRTGLATSMAEEISKIAKEKGCKYLSGTCVPSTVGSTASLKAMFSYGFKIHSSQNDLIVLIKEL
jgi:GNAT superfamily N-acetyltransferase